MALLKVLQEPKTKSWQKFQNLSGSKSGTIGGNFKLGNTIWKKKEKTAEDIKNENIDKYRNDPEAWDAASREWHIRDAQAGMNMDK